MTPESFTQPGYALIWSGQPREVAARIAKKYDVRSVDIVCRSQGRAARAENVSLARMEFDEAAVANGWSNRLLHEQWPQIGRHVWHARRHNAKTRMEARNG